MKLARTMPLLVVTVVAATMLYGCSAVGTSKVATVNGHVITEQAFDETYKNVLASMNLDPSSVSADKSSGLSDFVKKIAVESVIFDSIAKTEAEKRHITVSDQEVQENYKHLVAQTGSEKTLLDTLKTMHTSKESFLKQLKEQMLKDKLAASIDPGKIAVSDGQAKRFYNAHPKMFDQPEQVRARHILIAANADQMKTDLKSLKPNTPAQDVNTQIEKNMTEKRQKAQSLLNKVQMSPQAFETLAKQNSDDPGSSKNGGDLGYFSREAMVPAFAEAAFSTKPGSIHNTLVQTPFGFHIIEVVDRKPAEKKTFEQVKPDLIAMLEGQKKQQVLQSWLIEEKKKATIVIEPKYKFDSGAKLVSPETNAVPLTTEQKH